MNQVGTIRIVSGQSNKADKWARGAGSEQVLHNVNSCSFRARLYKSNRKRAILIPGWQRCRLCESDEHDGRWRDKGGNSIVASDLIAMVIGLSSRQQCSRAINAKLSH